MARSAVTIFLSAFLLFQVQPLIGKAILPWFGGSPAVWATCLVFFQSLLLAGYAYAHWLASHFSLRWQGRLHATVLLLSLAWLPLRLAASLKPTGQEDPIAAVLLTLLLSVGGPYLVLSSTGPLLQGWFSRLEPHKNPYRLYSLSNLGSMLALLSYPLLFEPFLPVPVHLGWLGWSGAYVLFVVACLWCAAVAARYDLKPPRAQLPQHQLPSNSLPSNSLPSNSLPSKPQPNQSRPSQRHLGGPWSEPANQASSAPSLGKQWLWVGLSGSGAALLAATTSQICQNVAVVPFLLVIPLALYLWSLIICFDRDERYNRTWHGTIGVICLAMVATTMYCSVLLHAALATLVYLFTLYIGCMLCHGELVRSRPHPYYLTRFYFMVSLGGALGGLSVAVVAPWLFWGAWEYPLALMATITFVLVSLGCDRQSPLAHWRPPWAWGLLLVLYLLSATVLGLLVYVREGSEAECTLRNFFGVKVVKYYTEPVVYPNYLRHGDRKVPVYLLMHGTITHGYQFDHPVLRQLPTSYYQFGSGIHVACEYHPQRLASLNPESLPEDQRTDLESFRSHPSSRRSAGLHIGVVGLGAGTSAALCYPEDTLRYYEIDPQVIALSYPFRGQPYFRYLQDAEDRGVDVAVVLGDARVQLEQDLALQKQGVLPPLDVLAVDAFSGDAIPVHLMTRECFEIYDARLAETGVLAIHLSNQYVDLAPVVYALGQRLGYHSIPVEHPSCLWILLSRNRDWIKRLSEFEELQPTLGTDWPPARWQQHWPNGQLPQWSDNSINLLAVLRFDSEQLQIFNLSTWFQQDQSESSELEPDELGPDK